MMDYRDDDLTAAGYYLVTYGREQRPDGPFPTVRDMADALDLDAYPGDGYVVYYDPADPAFPLSHVPSLNPDDLLSPA